MLRPVALPLRDKDAAAILLRPVALPVRLSARLLVVLVVLPPPSGRKAQTINKGESVATITR